MSDRFKIGEGFVSIDTEDDTPSGLARIKAGVDRWTDGVQSRISAGLRSGFDQGADAAEARMAKFTREVTGELDKIAAKRTKIDVDILDAAEKIVKLRKEAETATIDRKLKIEAEIAAASAEMKVLKREAEDLDGQKIELEAKLKNGPETAFEIKELDKAANNWIKTSAGFASSFGGITANVSGLLSLLGPVTNGIIGTVAATGQWLAAVSPLAALLPGLAASTTVLGLTVKAVIPSLAESFTPVTDAAKELQKELGDAAQKGVSGLAESFVKANFPAVEAGTMRIADAINYVVTKVLAWTSTVEGQRAVGQVVDAAADAAERLAPSIAALVISFGNFIAKAGDPIIRGLADIFGDLMDKTNGWIDRITSEDISAGFQKLKDAASAFTDKLQAAKDVVEWLAANRGTITAISDALAGIGIVLGVATGNWVAVIAGAVTLILNHFDTVKQAATDVGKWFSGVFSAIANDPWVQAIIADLGQIASIIQDRVMSALDLLRQGWEKMQPALQQFWDVMGPIVHEFLANEQVQQGIGYIAEGLVLIAGALAMLVLAGAGAVGAFTALTELIKAWVVGTLIDTVVSAFGTVTTFLSEVPGMISGAWSMLTTIVSDAWNAVVTFIESLPGRISATWTSIYQATMDTWGQILTFLAGLPAQVLAFFTQIATEGPAKIGEMAGQLVGQFVTMGLNIIAAIAGLPAQIGAIFTQAKTVAVSLAGQLVSEAISFLAQLPARASSAVSGIVGNISTIFNNAKAAASQIAGQLVSEAISFLAQLPAKASSAINGLISNVTAVFTSAKTAAVREATALVAQAIAVIATLPAKAVAALAGIGNALVGAGQELIGGFIRGIQSKLPDLSGALNAVTNALPDWKGPAERDATILEPSGELVMAGFGKGIAAGRRDIERQLADITAGVGAIGAQSAAGAAAGTAGGGGTSYSFAAGSIVLDASKIRSLQDLIDMIEGIRSTARQYGAVPRSA